MNPIKLYFVGAVGKEEIFKRVNNILCSYLYIHTLYQWADLKGKKPTNFIIDSGAYSAWNVGKVIDLNAYINFCKDLKSDSKYKHHTIRFVNLDVIPGKRGVLPSKEDTEKAIKEGFKNLDTFLANGITPIHVFHQGESFKWIDKMVEKTDYIGISPMEDYPVTVRRRWIDDVFSYVYKNNYRVKTHGFGIFIKKILLNYPWTSVDSTTCHMVAGKGSIYYPKGGFSNPDYSKTPHLIPISKERLYKNKILFLAHIENILEKDGYSFEELKTSRGHRLTVNTRYYVEFEAAINKLKKKIGYKSSTKIME